MSGHSKWATTKRRKEAVDAKRSGLFTKLAKSIAVAAREGADPDTNFKLRIAIDQAKSFSLPKDNVERAIARGSGTSEGVRLETIMYEAFGPGGVAVIIETVTDNKNRTAAEIKHILSKHGGNMGGSNSVAWMFDPRGLITITEPSLTEEQELKLIDAGIIDAQHDDDATTLITELDHLQRVEEMARKLGLTIQGAQSGYLAKELISPPDKNRIIKLLEDLDDCDDVNNLFTNANL